jgi:hypothetical protein
MFSCGRCLPRKGKCGGGGGVVVVVMIMNFVGSEEKVFTGIKNGTVKLTVPI